MAEVPATLFGDEDNNITGLCADPDGQADEIQAICAMNDALSGGLTGLDTFFLIFAVRLYASLFDTRWRLYTVPSSREACCLHNETATPPSAFATARSLMSGCEHCILTCGAKRVFCCILCSILDANPASYLVFV